MKGSDNSFLAVRVAAVMFLAACWPAWAASKEGATVSATLAADGRTFTVTAPGLTGFQGSFSARITIGGQITELSSTNGVMVGTVEQGTEATPYGRAELAVATLRFEREQIDLLLRLGRVPGVPGVLAQVGIRNAGQQPVNLHVLRPVVMTGRVDGNPSDWLVTSLNSEPESTNLGDIRTRSRHVWEYGSLYRGDGTGFFFGPVGAPISYLNTRITPSGKGNMTLAISAQMDMVRVDPGETRWGQQVVVLMEKPSLAFARWAEWVGKTHGARTSKGALTGWSSWYFLAGFVTGKDVLDVVDTVKKSQGRLRPNVIQIDEGYEDPLGEKETNEKFPEGLTFYAQRIAAIGARPGLQVGLRRKPEEVYLMRSKDWPAFAQRIRHAVRCGFSFVKLDFYGVDFWGQNFDPKKTMFELVREGFAMLREVAGNETYLLYCNYEPNRATVGLVDASRTGFAATRGSLQSAIDGALTCYQLHNRWFAVDDGNYYMGTDIANVSQIAGGWPLVRTWISMTGLSCGAAFTSDPWHWDDFKPYWRNVEVLTPPAEECTEVLDLCTSRELSRLVGHVNREWGDSTVALLWNPNDTEHVIKLNFAEAGLDPSRRYAVWSFWDNRYLGVTKGSWITPSLGASASQHLCFTDLDRTPNKPVFIGSNLHIYCGAAEIKRIVSLRSSMQIELTDAGARDGDLFVYSRLPLLLKAATGCDITGVTQAGENVWRISLADRQRGAAQRVELHVMLPVTQQLWFWLVMAIVAASLLFAAWRYFVGLRLEREYALAKERARIACDMHDDIGSKLARLSMVGQMAIDELALQTTTQQKPLVELIRGLREIAGELELIIWSVNPKRDNLEDLAQQICRYAEEFFADTPVRCRFEVLPSLPERVMRSEMRTAVMRAVKEALANVLKHAAATTVDIGFRMDVREFQVRIADNGRGFDLAQLGPSAVGNGLVNMRERMAILAGECRIESAPGRGTTVVLCWPLDKTVKKG